MVRSGLLLVASLRLAAASDCEDGNCPSVYKDNVLLQRKGGSKQLSKTSEAVARPCGENVARGTWVSCSEGMRNCAEGGDGAVDGISASSSHKSAPSAKVESCDQSAYLVVDLGKETAINDVTLHGYVDGSRRYCGRMVEVSSDGESWEAAFNGGDEYGAVETSQGTEMRFDDVMFGRYVKVYSSRSSANKGAHFIEVEVTCKDAEACCEAAEATEETAEVPDDPEPAMPEQPAMPEGPRLYELLADGESCPEGKAVMTAAECEEAANYLQLSRLNYSNVVDSLVMGNFNTNWGDGVKTYGFKQPPQWCSYAFAIQFGRKVESPFGAVYFNDPNNDYSGGWVSKVKHCHPCGTTRRRNARLSCATGRERPDVCRRKEEAVPYQRICKVEERTGPVATPWWETCQPFSPFDGYCGKFHGRCKAKGHTQRYCSTDVNNVMASHCEDVYHKTNNIRGELGTYFDSNSPACEETFPMVGIYEKQANTRCGELGSCGGKDGTGPNALAIKPDFRGMQTYLPGARRVDVTNCKILCDRHEECAGFAFRHPQHCFFYKSTTCHTSASSSFDCYTKGEGMEPSQILPTTTTTPKPLTRHGGCNGIIRRACCGLREGRNGQYKGQDCMPAADGKKYRGYSAKDYQLQRIHGECEPAGWAENQPENMGSCEDWTPPDWWSLAQTEEDPELKAAYLELVSMDDDVPDHDAPQQWEAQHFDEHVADFIAEHEDA